MQLLESELEHLQSTASLRSPQPKIVCKQCIKVEDSGDEQTKRACYEHVVGPLDDFIGDLEDFSNAEYSAEEEARVE
ncbi:hypothetical protein C0989_006177 [Termitomyces sp. Mn162]|nr:hypothetical protein C0989_006177 [Termitomyces sp. Mn162]